jgi:PAS domain S-box-containing protein
MADKPDIVKKLMEEEKLGKLESSLQGSHEELERPEELPEDPFEDVPDEIIEDIENTEKAGEDRIYSKKYDKLIGEVLKIIQFAEKVATKIHGATDEAEIYRLVMEEFKKSKEYSANILLLTNDESELSIMTSIKSKRVRTAEKLTGLKQERFKIPLSKAKTYSRVVREGETLHVKVSDILNELFSRPNAYLIAKATGNIKNYDIVLTPLNVGGKIIGIFAMTSPFMVEEFIPSIKNLATHISASLELAKEKTKRKEVEKSLKKSEEQYQDIALSSADWIWEVDKDGKYTFASGKVKNILGYESSELLGKTPFDFMPEDEAKRIGKIFKKIISEKKPIVDLENWNLTKEGEKICLLTNGIPMLSENSELIGYRGVDKDITDRKQAAEALKENEEKYRSLIANIPDISWTTSEDGHTTFISENILDAYGYSPEEIYSSCDKLFFERVHPDDIIRVKDSFHKLFKENMTMNIEYRIQRKDGEWIWLNDRSTGTYEKDGKIFADGILTEITERKKAEEELKISCDELGKKVDELETFQGFAVDRELKMVELKKEVNELCEKLGEKPRYDTNL